LCQQFTETTTHRRLSQVLVFSWVLGIGASALLATWVWYWIVVAKENSKVSQKVPDYSFDFMEHQNYWEAENRW